MKLLIVESPAKAKTIAKYLGSGYTVRASMGHVSDLPTDELAVDVTNAFKPTYKLLSGKTKLIRELKEYAAKASEILLATDPDREGEMIAWHLAEQLKRTQPKIKRVSFHEITPHAIQKAVASPQAINQNLVAAQQARRVLDRLFGYKLSPFLWQRLSNSKGLSAGRVQSAALRLVCERELAIADFIPQPYWNLEALFETPNKERFAARLHEWKGKTVGSPAAKGVQVVISSAEQAHALAERARKEAYHIQSVEKKTVRRLPPPPFTTSTLQQAASNRLGMSPKAAMRIAQQLYEGVALENGQAAGLITYMRTDATRISEDTITSIREWVARDIGLEYLPEKPHRHEGKKAKNAQEAHEAIRPTLIERTPKQVRAFLSPEQYKLYTLIWQRSVASQMAASISDQTTVSIASASGEFVFRATGSVLKFRGFLQVYEDNPEEIKANTDPDAPSNQALPPSLVMGMPVALLELTPKEQHTKPPPRYTEASLVKALEAFGIGRPSTYAAILHTILDRQYARLQAKQLYAEEIGLKVNEMLTQHFPALFDLQFTARMENELDHIAQGQRAYLEAMQSFYHQQLIPALERAVGALPRQPQNDLKTTSGAAPRSPRKVAKPKTPSAETSATSQADPNLPPACPNCGRAMQKRQGKTGSFWGCSGFPHCKTTRPLEDTSTGVACPSCHKGFLSQRKTKDGKLFYGCSTFPICHHALWEKPINQACAKCGNYYLVEKLKRDGTPQVLCPHCKASL